jgi:hypothetical protein
MAGASEASEIAQRTLPSARQASPWIKRLARFGMICAGALYILIGGLAIGLAAGAGGKATDRTGALHEIGGKPWGTAVLVVLAIGFAGFALWRFTVAVVGEKLETYEDLGWGKRAWYAARGGFYAVLCYATVEFLVDARASSGNERQQTETVLEWPGGRWLVGAAGVGILGWGIGNAYRGISRNFKDDLRTGQMSAETGRWVTRAGVVGYVARAVVFALIGVFLIRAAIQYDPKEAIGIDGALQKVADQTFGPLLLGVVAAGLIAYGLFYFVRAGYREV